MERAIRIQLASVVGGVIGAVFMFYNAAVGIAILIGVFAAALYGVATLGENEEKLLRRQITINMFLGVALAVVGAGSLLVGDVITGITNILFGVTLTGTALYKKSNSAMQ